MEECVSKLFTQRKFPSPNVESVQSASLPLFPVSFIASRLLPDLTEITFSGFRSELRRHSGPKYLNLAWLQLACRRKKTGVVKS